MKSNLEMNDINQVKNNIKNEIQKKKPSPKKIISYLSKFTFKEIKYGKEINIGNIILTSTEFYDIVGEIFKLNPRFFLNSLHYKLRNKIHKRYGVEKRNEMDKYIVENFSLYKGEQILYECDGSIKQLLNNNNVYALSGSIFITNCRIIAQGWLGTSNNSDRNAVIERSLKEIPCYGFIYPIKNLYKIRKSQYSISYRVKSYKIKIYSFSTKSSKRKNINKIFEILSKIKDEPNFPEYS